MLTIVSSNRKRWLAAFVVVLLGGLAACGADDDDATGTAADVGGALAEPSPAPDVGAGLELVLLTDAERAELIDRLGAGAQAVAPSTRGELIVTLEGSADAGELYRATVLTATGAAGPDGGDQGEPLEGSTGPSAGGRQQIVVEMSPEREFQLPAAFGRAPLSAQAGGRWEQVVDLDEVRSYGRLPVQDASVDHQGRWIAIDDEPYLLPPVPLPSESPVSDLIEDLVSAEEIYSAGMDWVDGVALVRHYARFAESEDPFEGEPVPDEAGPQLQFWLDADTSALRFVERLAPRSQLGLLLGEPSDAPAGSWLRLRLALEASAEPQDIEFPNPDEVITQGDLAG